MSTSSETGAAVRAFIQPYLVEIQQLANKLRLAINAQCRDLEAWQIIAITVLIIMLIHTIKDILFQDESLFTRIKGVVFRLIRKVPSVRQYIDREMSNAKEMIQQTLNDPTKDLDSHTTLQYGKMAPEDVIKLLTKYDCGSFDWRNGFVSGTVYGGDPGITKLNEEIFHLFAWANPLHPDVFPGIRKLEAEVVRICCDLFHGDINSCGTMSSGGTESILLVMLAYRNYAYNHKGIKKPNVLIPVTAHAAFDKACHMYQIKPIHIPVNRDTCKVDVRAMRRAIDGNTIALVGSTPQFPHGIIDPIEEIAKLGLSYNIPVHVDCCLGSFMMAFMDKAGFPVAPFDFRVKGVTSISADTHKYGYTPKGTSVILYRNAEYRKEQFFVAPDWPGGVYASPTLAGSRPGFLMAGTFGTMICHGQEGYIQNTKQIIQTRMKIEAGLRKIPEIKILGEPQFSVIAITSERYSCYRLSSALSKKGWNLNILQFPPAFHICITLLWTKAGVAERFVRDVTECSAEITKNPDAPLKGVAAVYGSSQSIPDRSLIAEMGGLYLDAFYQLQPEPIVNGKGDGVKHGKSQ